VERRAVVVEGVSEVAPAAPVAAVVEEVSAVAQAPPEVAAVDFPALAHLVAPVPKELLPRANG
jgi:hypothetical protein